jgi:hypothetical protein
MFRGGRPSLSPTGQNFPDEAVSIGKLTSYVKRKSIRKSGKFFEFPSLPLDPCGPNSSNGLWPGKQTQLKRPKSPYFTISYIRPSFSLAP